MSATRTDRMKLRRARSIWRDYIRPLAEDAVREHPALRKYQPTINELDLCLRTLKLVPTDEEAWDQVDRIAEIADVSFSKWAQAAIVASLRNEEPTPKVISRILKQEFWK